MNEFIHASIIIYERPHNKLNVTIPILEPKLGINLSHQRAANLRTAFYFFCFLLSDVRAVPCCTAKVQDATKLNFKNLVFKMRGYPEGKWAAGGMEGRRSDKKIVAHTDIQVLGGLSA